MKILCAILIFLTASFADAATYYLRADGEAADKESASGCGAAGTAMSLTVHNAETFSAGDVIELCDDGGSTYTGRLIPPSSGSEGSPITYQAESGATIVVDADGVTAEAFRIVNQSYITVTDLRFTGGTGAGVYAVSSGADVSNIILDGIWSYSHGGPGIQFNSSGSSYKIEDITISDSTISTNASAGISVTGIYRVEGVTIQRNTVNGNNTDQLGRQAIGIAMPVASLTLSTGWTQDGGIDGDGDYYQSLATTPLRVYQKQLTADQRELTAGSGDLADGEWEYKGGNLHIDIGEDPDGLEIVYLIDYYTDITVEENLIYDQINHSSGWDGTCIFFDWGVRNATAKYNRCYDGQGGGIHVLSGETINIYGNLIYGNCTDEYSESAGIKLNIGANDVNIYNNTIYGNSCDGIKTATNVDTVVIKNNIIRSNGDYAINDSDDEAISLSEDYNNISDHAVAARNNIAAGSNSFYDNPLFADEANDVFWLQDSSPAKQTGTPIDLGLDGGKGLLSTSSWPDDVKTFQRSNPPSMGAYFFGGVSTGMGLN